MKRSGKLRYLFKNMALFTVSSFVSKLLVFFLVPFYTSVLTESEYGIADVMQSSLLLLVPLLTINAGEAALRFGLEYTDRRSSLLSIGLKKVFLSVVPVALISVALSFCFTDYRFFFMIFILLYIASSFYEFMLLYCQGTEEVQKMITGSVSSTLFVIVSNLVLLLIFNMGLTGYLISQILAFSASAILMFFLVDGRNKLKEAGNDRELIRECSVYGRSMLLYSTASWINNAIDRYFILFILGSGQNGLYGAAYKIPAILTTLQRIFAMAWQMSAVKEYKGEDRDEFFSRMYRSYQTVLVLGCSGIILFLKFIARFMFRGGFFEAWVLVPPLLISVIFGALEGFLGSIALAFKDGKSMGKATLLGALVNIILNYFWILEFGTFGAAAATFISYFVMFAAAFILVRQHVKLEVFLFRDLVAYVLLVIESLLIIFNMKNYPYWNAAIVVILLCIYFREIKEIMAELLRRIRPS